MTNRSDVWNLLLARKGEWVTREDLKFVGGESWDRRHREVEEDVARSGTYRLERRYEANTMTAIRLVELPKEETADVPENNRLAWVCSVCQNPPFRYSQTQPSVDPRWRVGVCWTCDKKGKRIATYVRAASRVPVVR